MGESMMDPGAAYLEGMEDAASMTLHYLRGVEWSLRSKGDYEGVEFVKHIRRYIATLHGIDNIPDGLGE